MEETQPVAAAPLDAGAGAAEGAGSRPSTPAPGAAAFVPAVRCVPSDGSGVHRVVLESDGQGKRRDFYYDFAFPPEASQDDVYDSVGGPVVHDVLRGYNGTIMA
jgi:hypothetical protein